mgnify:CR=1 FL=1
MPNIKVIIADDYAAVREATRAVLELQPDIEVIGEASNGSEAVNQALKLNPHVVVTDASMPIMDGIEACRRIKATCPRVGIVLMTTDMLRRQEALEAGADDYVLKDSPSEDLIVAIRRVYLENVAAAALEDLEPEWRPVVHELVLLHKLAPELVQEAVAGAAPGESIGSVLVRTGYVSGEDLAIALSRALSIPRAYLTPYPAIEEPIHPLTHRLRVDRVIDPVEREAANLITEDAARKRRLIPISKFDGELAVAMANPLDKDSQQYVARETGLRVQPVVSTPEEIDRAITRAFGPPSEGIAQMRPPRPAIRQLPKWWPKALKYTPLELGTVAAVGLIILVMLGFLRDSFAMEHIAATVGLSCGFFFFLYGAKYYVTSIAVLACSALGPGIIGQRSRHDDPGDQAANGRLDRNGLNGNNGKNGNGYENAQQPSLSGAADPYRTLRGHYIDRHGRIIADSSHLPHSYSGSPGNGEYRKEPFVSVHLATYNERFVIERLLVACTSFDYENYEVIVADDSTDESVEILNKWKRHPRVKILHRDVRKGFKGGALQVALRHTNPHAKYVMVFDADFVPAPDTIRRFISYFEVQDNGNGSANGNGNGNHNGNGYRDERVAVVQGYQWHMLNAGENWVTKGVRTEFSGSYVVERAGQELFGGMKMISGSVYMIRADVLRQLGWSTSITEDWELTIRLYLAGYKVLYTPYIQAPAECVSSFRRLTKQRMRWAEGHTYNVKKYFWQVLRSPNLTLGEKVEFLYFAPYYLQAVLFALGTTGWMLSEFLLHKRLPNWTATLGWSLVFSNVLSLPLMNLTGIVLERSLRRDVGGILAFLALSNLLAPFQGYAAVKGLLEKEEGGWTRTPKTGRITELFGAFSLRARLGWMFPRRRSVERAFASGRKPLSFGIASLILVVLAILILSSAVPLALASSQGSSPFGLHADGSTRSASLHTSGANTSEGALIVGLVAPVLPLLALRMRNRRAMHAILAMILVEVLLLSSLAMSVPTVNAAPDALRLGRTIPDGWPGREMNSTSLGDSGSTLDFSPSNADYYWYTPVYPGGSGPGNVAAGPYSFTAYYSFVPREVAQHASYYVEVGYSDPDGSNYVMLARSAVQIVDRDSPVDTAISFPIGNNSSPTYFYADSPKRIRFQIHYVDGDSSFGLHIGDSRYPASLSTPTITVPESVLGLALLAPVFPLVALWLHKGLRRGFTPATRTRTKERCREDQ